MSESEDDPMRSVRKTPSPGPSHQPAIEMPIGEGEGYDAPPEMDVLENHLPRSPTPSVHDESREGTPALPEVPRVPLTRDQMMRRQIRREQNMTDLVIPKTRFARLCRELARNVMFQGYWGDTDPRWEEQALKALQEATEAFFVGIFEDANLIANNAKRVTMMSRDFHLVLRIRNEPSLGPYTTILATLANREKEAAVKRAIMKKKKNERKKNRRYGITWSSMWV